jgi:hypothetical protein
MVAAEQLYFWFLSIEKEFPEFAEIPGNSLVTECTLRLDDSFLQ